MKILAPCGNADSLITAINHGADAVYLGVDSFNARMNADNFTLENLREYVKLSHLHNVDVYLTLNTSIKDKEFNQAISVAIEASRLKVDGIIVSDIGLMSAIKQALPSMHIVCSTQANICNKLSAQFIKGICNSIVISRECNSNDIKDIKSVGLPVEYFAQGAMCVSVSGQCLMSSIIGGNSGNRGMCAQPCRQNYTSYTESERKIKQGYLLSTSDLCLLPRIKELKNLNVDMIKIEGRNRRSQYVGQAVSSYKKAIRNEISLPKELTLLRQVFNRGDYTEGYLDKESNLMSIDIQGHKGELVGKLLMEKNTSLLLAYKDLFKGDCFKILRGNKEVGSAVLECDILANCKGQIKCSSQCENNDRVHLTTSVNQNKYIDGIKRKINITFELTALVGYPLTLSCECNGRKVESKGDICQQGINSILTESEARLQLSKCQDTAFNVISISTNINDVFVAKSQLNALRREVIDLITNAILSGKEVTHTVNEISYDFSVLPCDRKRIIIYIDEFYNFPQKKTLESDVELIYVLKPSTYSIQAINPISEVARQRGIELYLDLPNFANTNDVILLKEILNEHTISGIVANNVYAIEISKQYNAKLILGCGLNIYNKATLSYYQSIVGNVPYIFSTELNANELWNDSNGFVYGEGMLKTMTMCHCPIQINFDCTCKTCKYEPLYYVDKIGARFKIDRTKVSKCYFNVYNNLSISLYNKLKNWRNIVINTIGNDNNILDNYIEFALTNSKTNIDNGHTTSGHFSRGVK